MKKIWILIDVLFTFAFMLLPSVSAEGISVTPDHFVMTGCQNDNPWASYGPVFTITNNYDFPIFFTAGGDRDILGEFWEFPMGPIQPGEGFLVEQTYPPYEDATWNSLGYPLGEYESEIYIRIYREEDQGDDGWMWFDDTIFPLTYQVRSCSPTPTPEFPSTLLPAAMIIGFLGAVLLIQRTREQ